MMPNNIRERDGFKCTKNDLPDYWWEFKVGETYYVSKDKDENKELVVLSYNKGLNRFPVSFFRGLDVLKQNNTGFSKHLEFVYVPLCEYEEIE